MERENRKKLQYQQPKMTERSDRRYNVEKPLWFLTINPPLLDDEANVCSIR